MNKSIWSKQKNRAKGTDYNRIPIYRDELGEAKSAPAELGTIVCELAEGKVTRAWGKAHI